MLGATALWLIGALAPVEAPSSPAGGKALEVRPRRAAAGPARPAASSPAAVPRPVARAVVDPVQAQRDAVARELGLVPRGDGYAYSGREDERFDATIARDGTVTFDVDPSVQVKVDGVCLLAFCARTREGRRAQRRRAGSRAARTATAVLAEAALAGLTGTFVYGRASQPPPTPLWEPRPRPPPPIPGLTIQGRYGYLPTPLASMSDFMDRTFDLRLAMAQSAALDDLEAEHTRLPGKLARIWADPARTDAERRVAILDLWADLEAEADAPAHRDDVLAEPLARNLQTRRHELATKARRTIVKSVRRHAPAGSPRAFTDAELADFAARPDATVPFVPYAADGSPPR